MTQLFWLILNNPTDCFYIDNFGNIEYSKIGWWGETHTKVIIGLFGINQNNCVIHFYCEFGVNFLGLGNEMNATVNK